MLLPRVKKEKYGEVHPIEKTVRVCTAGGDLQRTTDACRLLLPHFRLLRRIAERGRGALRSFPISPQGRNIMNSI